jgi:diguanylate cyclase (GGDEF)-like protein
MRDSGPIVPPHTPGAPESGPVLLARRAAIVAPFSHSANENDVPLRKVPLPPIPLASPLASDPEAIVTVFKGAHAGPFAATFGTPMTIGRAPDADLVVEDSGVSPYHVRIARARGTGYFVEDLGSATGTFLGAAPIGVALLRHGDRLQLGPNVHARFAMVAPVPPLAPAAQPPFGIPTSPGYDALTHVYNRLTLQERLIAEIVYAQRAQSGLGALAIDVDDLEDINDRFGRLVGDRVLCTVAARIRGLLGVEDTLARHGGDEFVVLAVGSTGADALDLAERVRRAAEDLHCGPEARITVSVGVAFLAELPPGVDPARALLSTARARMHRAQAAGANHVCATE